MKIVISAILSLFVTVPLLAQNKSAKRGIGWDEKTQKMSGLPISKMAPGVSWVYNWGIKPGNDLSGTGPQGMMDFVPMCWNGNFDEAGLRRRKPLFPGEEGPRAWEL